MADMVREWKRAIHDPAMAQKDATIAAQSERIEKLARGLRLVRDQIDELDLLNGPCPVTKLMRRDIESALTE